MTYRFVDAALAEYIESARYDNRQVPGLGDEFTDEIEAVMPAIQAAPLRWRVIEDDVRRYLRYQTWMGIGAAT